jgi:thioesterase-3
VKSVGNRSAVIHQRVTLDGSDKVVAEADVTFVAFDGRQNKAVPIEGKMRELLEGLQHQA